MVVTFDALLTHYRNKLQPCMQNYMFNKLIKISTVYRKSKLEDTKTITYSGTYKFYLFNLTKVIQFFKENTVYLYLKVITQDILFYPKWKRNILYYYKYVLPTLKILIVYKR